MCARTKMTFQVDILPLSIVAFDSYTQAYPENNALGKTIGH